MVKKVETGGTEREEEEEKRQIEGQKEEMHLMIRRRGLEHKLPTNSKIPSGLAS